MSAKLNFFFCKRNYSEFLWQIWNFVLLESDCFREEDGQQQGEYIEESLGVWSMQPVRPPLSKGTEKLLIWGDNLDSIKVPVTYIHNQFNFWPSLYLIKCLLPFRQMHLLLFISQCVSKTRAVHLGGVILVS